MKYTIEIEVGDEIDGEIDLQHMLESVSDALYWSDNVTAEEQDLVIDFMQKLIRNENKG